jgi:hypothetical protein
MTHIAQDVLAAFGTRKFEFRHTFQDLLVGYLLPLPLILVQTFPVGCLHFRNKELGKRNRCRWFRRHMNQIILSLWQETAFFVRVLAKSETG